MPPGLLTIAIFNDFLIRVAVMVILAVLVPVHAAEGSDIRLAIWPLDGFSMGGGLSSEDIQIVQEIVPDMLTTTLSSNSRVRLVERQKLMEVLNEQRLGTTELADDATRLRLGRILGARYMLFGTYLKLGPTWQIDVRLVDTESSRILATSSANQDSGDLLAAAQQLGASLLPSLK